MNRARSTNELIAAATADGWQNDKLGREIIEALQSQPQPSRRLAWIAGTLGVVALIGMTLAALQLAQISSLEGKERGYAETIRTLTETNAALKKQISTRDEEITRVQSSSQGTLDMINRRADTLTKHLQDQISDLTVQRAALEKRVLELEAELRARRSTGG